MTEQFGQLLPLAPIIARDGRPFDLGAKARSLPWLLPSVTAGCVRSLIGRNAGRAIEPDELREVNIGGPLPIHDGKLYFPAPADAFAKKSKDPKASPDQLDHTRLRVPDAANTAADVKGWCRWPWAKREARPAHTSLDYDDLAFVEIDDPAKPEPVDAWWSVDDMADWLKGASRSTKNEGQAHFPATLPQVSRTHAKLLADNGTVDEVFRTVGLDFQRERNPGRNVRPDSSVDPIGIALRIDPGETGLAVPDACITTLGGERRPAWWQPSSDGDPWAIPDDLIKAFAETEKARSGRTPLRVRMLLATPAYFGEGGWLPDWLSATSDDGKTKEGTPPGANGVTLKLVAAVVKRWQGVSGWDMDSNRPKPTRRLVPAGSVYVFDVIEGTPDWRALWLRSVCRDLASVADGFGLALWGLDQG